MGLDTLQTQDPTVYINRRQKFGTDAPEGCPLWPNCDILCLFVFLSVFDTHACLFQIINPPSGLQTSLRPIAGQGRVHHLRTAAGF